MEINGNSLRNVNTDLMVKPLNNNYNGGVKQSSRGISLLDRVERFTINNLHPQIPYRAKLRALVNSYPDNKFFNSVATQFERKGKLSRKQVNAVDRSFNALIKQKQRLQKPLN